MSDDGAVLVVDDEPGIRKLYAEALRGAGYEVALAATAQEARDAMTSTRCVAALVDLRMEGEDGLALLSWLVEAHPNVPVAIVTAHGDVPTAVEAMRRGAFDFVLKPSRPEALRGLVARMAEPAAGGAGGEYDELVTQAIEAGRARQHELAWGRARTALALDPQRPEALTVLGVLVELRGDWIAAQSFHRAALALDPTCRASRVNLERLTSLDRSGAPRWGDETP